MTSDSRKTESEFYVRKRELRQLFDKDTPLNVDLYRGQKPDERGSPILYPILKAYMLSNGRERPVDIETFQKDGVLWVNSASGGVSLFDIIGNPSASWDYYKINAGTAIPLGLVITKDKTLKPKNKTNEPAPTHYSIRPHWDMPLKQFLMLLDDLVASFKRVR